MESIHEFGSVTRAMDLLRVGNDDGVTQLWNKYAPRMVRVAFSKFGMRRERNDDAEDVARSAFGHFCLDAADGAFPWVTDRESLWPVLMTITARRAARLSRDELRLKRSALRRDHRELHTLELASSTLPPDEVMLLNEQVTVLLDCLRTPLLRRVAILKMDGFTNEEVAKEVNVAVRSVERKLQLIREIWLSHGQQPETE
ncbi:DNA-directed RNA polymerase specialized sigma24 family protein [Rhodopirellula rubra]|uniref:DNA-directed RNA polymerase specialized sigma24 family protein n=1 Tax=Aporhodopirellula rubra TaxID=980271 RepID=A0A7W5E1K9_9BACT|nr:ECF-type sigma factor [Aporhodopirellula rubra]MBB3208137.1 DNA-directed RNA polymerase specialized sigma24 family protein [Aporhodopirellula rubra]